VGRTLAAISTAAAIAIAAVGCQHQATGCQPGEPFCYCKEGSSCTQACDGRDGCSLFCANHNVSCAMTAGDRCAASCQNAQTCSATCGRQSTVACQYVSGRCSATLGDGSRAHCEGAASCDITCTGACDVDCPGGRCRVQCAAAGACNVSCDKGVPAAVCPDGVTRACGTGCS
jgi:hypothetical protein